MRLSESALSALARRVMYRHIEDTESWLEWEDYPTLTEGQFENLDARIRHFARERLQQADSDDRLGGVDSRLLLETAMAVPMEDGE